MRADLLLALAVTLYPAAALAHGGDEPARGAAPAVAGLLSVSAILFATGVARLWARAGVGRGIGPLQAGLFLLGWASLMGALFSPLHRLGERLFTAHMTEHEILMVVAAPLVAVSRPVGAMLWAFPRQARRAAARVGNMPGVLRARWLGSDPFAATALHGAALWAWHLPGPYAAALASDGVHWLQHVSFFGSGLLFWWAILRGPAGRRGYGVAVFCLFVTALHSGFLGILLAVARYPVFPAQTSAAPEFGLTPLEDQQLAGLIMWVPAGVLYAVAALAFAGAWITYSGTLGHAGGRHAPVGR